MPSTIDWTGKKTHWIELVTALVDDIATWCEDFDWSYTRSTKLISEERVGAYEVPCLVIQTPSVRLHIDPDGLDVMDADGRIDIFAHPSLNRLLLLRKNDNWKLFTDAGVPDRKQWGRDTFFSIVESLSS